MSELYARSINRLRHAEPLAGVKPFSAISASTSASARILLAEDDALLNKHLTQSLSDLGFSVCSTFDGSEALLAFNQQQFDILVTDIVMPKLGGIELTQRLQERIPNFPIVLISGCQEEMKVLRKLPSSQVVFLQKPFPITRLEEVIRSLLTGCRVSV